MLRLKIGLADGISHPAESNLCHTAAKTTQQDKGILGVGMKKPLYQFEHEKLIRQGDRSRIKTCRWCDNEIDDAQEYCSDECSLNDEQHSKDGGK